MVLVNGNRRVTQINQVADYPLEDFLGSLGGILGLAMGVSILSIAEVCMYFTLLALSKTC